MAAGNQMNLGVLVTPYINQQALNGMAAAAGSNFAAQFNTAVSRASQPLGRITGQVSEFEKSMAAANARVLAFGASAGSIYLVHDAFKRMVSSTVEVEKALADINVVLGLGQTALKSFSSTMFKAAAETGQTFETASKVALEFARHGVSATETAKRMVSAMQLMRISSLNAQQAVNAITAAINAFNKEGITSEDIVSRMTAVDTKFAVSAQDLARAIERVGSTAVDAGVKFNQLLALVTAVQTATSRGGAVIGNAFKSIFTRLSRPEVLDDLESVGVITKNSAGQILPMIEIMKRLASQYDHLSYAQKSFVSEAVGGVYQVNILKASLADLGRGFSIYDKAVIAASNSSGLIEKRMASLNDTIASKFNTATLKVTEFFATFGQMGFGAGAKKALDSFSSDMDLLIDSLADTTDSDGVGAKIGKSIAQGIVKGMGDIISGPGIQMAAMLTARLTRGLTAFTYKSGREVLGMNEGEHKQAAIQKSINEFLGRNVGLVDAWARGQITLNQLSSVYLKNLQASNILQARMANIGSGAANMVGGTISYTPAGGYVPSFRIASEDDARTERGLAMAHGYQAGPVVRKVVWDGHGGAQLTSINQRETVSEKMVNGHRGSLVVPPNGFGKGTIYAANGFVPSYSITPEALGSFSSGKELLKYVKSLGVKGSKGSSRMFIPLDENRGIKIAMNKAGIAQNEVEFPILNNDYYARQQYGDILPQGHGFDDNNFLWGIMERLQKPTANDFRKYTSKDRWKFMSGFHSMVEQQIDNFSREFGIIQGDFSGGRNVGIGNVVAPQQGLFEPQMTKGIKLLDIGFNDNVKQQFYSRRDLGKFAKGYVPSFANDNVLLAAKFYDALKVGKARGVHFGDNGVEKIEREVHGGIGFSSSSIGIKHGLASAVRNPGPTTRLTNIAKEYGVNKAIIAPIVSHIAVNPPLPLSMMSNEALLHQFLGSHQNPNSIISSFKKKGINIKEMLVDHAGSDMGRVINSLLGSHKELLYHSAHGFKDESLLNFFAPKGVKAHGPKEPHIFNTSVAHMTDGQFGVNSHGIHPSYPVVVKGHQGPKMSPVAAEEIFPSIRDNRKPLFFAANQAFGARILSLKNKSHMELLSKMGYNEEALHKSGFLATGFVPSFGLYHKDLGFPPEVASQLMALNGLTTDIIPSGHAKKAVLDDVRKFGAERIGQIPRQLKLNRDEIVEVEHDKFAQGFGKTNITKVVVRRKGANGLDQVMAILPNGLLKTVWHNDSNDVHKTLDASRYTKFAAGGFSIMGAVSDALKREGSATAAVGASPRLASVSNPLGLGVYDKSYQKNLEDAFAQHRAIGQTDIKNMGKASGFVPSFSLLGGAEASLVIGTLQGAFTNLNNALAPLTLGYNKQLEAIRKLNVEYSTVAQTIKQGGIAKYNGKTYDAQNGNMAQVYAAFTRDFRAKNGGFTSSPSVMNQVEQSYSAYREKVQARQGKISQYGNYGMLVGPMAGETAASIAGNFGAPNVQKGLEVFSSGITTAGQVLSAFPNKLGIGLAAGIGAKALSDSVSLYLSKFGELQKSFDLASTRAERMASAGNSVLESFERLKTASMDAGVGLDDFKALQIRHDKSIAELAAVPGGGAVLARKLTTATNESDMRKAVAQAVNLANVEKGESGTRMKLAQAKAESSSLLFGGQYQSVFAYSNDIQKLQKQQLLGETSSQLMQSTLDSNNLPKGFEDRMKKGALTGEDISTFTKEAATNSTISDLKPDDQKLALQHLTYELNKFKIPDGVNPNDWEEHINKLNEISQRELSIRERYNVELQNTLGKGSIITNFVSQQSRAGIESTYRKGQFESFRQEQGANLSSLITSDVSMIGIRGQIKEGQIRGQMRHDLAENLEKGGAGLMAALGATVKEYAGNAGQGGKGAAEKQDARTLSPRHIAQIEYLSKKQEELAKNPSKLLSLASANNPEKFAEAFIGKKSEVAGGYDKKFTTHEYETLSNKLSTTINGQQNHIGEILTSTKSITEKGLYELAMLGKETVNAMKEARFKELSGALKGVDELQHGGARKLRRELRRDEYIVNHSRNDIRRGDAAKELLGFIPSDERDYNNPKIKGLYNTAIRGSATAFDYIYGGTGMQQFSNSGERAAARIFGNYKGVNMPTEQTFGGEEASPIDTTALENSVDNAAKDIERFGQMLRNIGQPLASLKTSMDDATNERKKEGDQMKPQAGNGNEPTGGKVSPLKGGLAEWGLPAAALALSLGSMFFGKGKGFTLPKALAFTGAAAGVSGLANGGGAAAASGVAGGAAKLVEHLGGAGGAGVGAGIATAGVGTIAAIAEGAKSAKTLNFSFLKQLSSLGKVGATTGVEQNKAFLKIFNSMNSGEFSQFSKEVGGNGKAYRDMLRNGTPQIFNAEAKKIMESNMFQKVVNRMVSGAKVSGGPMGKFLLPELTKGSETMEMIQKVSELKSPSGLAKFVAKLNPVFKKLPPIENIGIPASELAKSVAPAAIKEGGLFSNALAGFKKAGALGKLGRVAGVAGAAFSGYEAYNQFKNKEYSRGLVNVGSTALSFAGPIGMIGAGVVQGAQAGMDKYRSYKDIQENETLRGQQLDQKNSFLARTQKEARRIASTPLSKRSKEDSEYLERWKGMFGATALQKTESLSAKKDAGDFFAKTKTQYMRNLAAPDMTFSKDGKTFGVFGEGNRTWSHAISDESQYHAERQKRYEQVMKDRRYSSYVNNAASQYAAEQTLRQYGEYAPEEAQKYSAQYTKQQAAAQERQEAQQPPKAQKQEVTIEAKPVELSVKLLNQNNEEIQTIQTQIAWLTQTVNALQGTPKPAAV